MSMRLVGLVLALCLVGAGLARAEDEGAAPVDMEALKLQLEELKKKQREVETKLGTFKKEVEKDEEVATLKKAMMDAKKAYDDKVKEKLEANAEAKALLDESQQLREKMGEVQKQMRPAPVKKEKPEGAKKKEEKPGEAPAPTM